MADSSVTGVTQVIQNLTKYRRAVIAEIVIACEAVQQNVKNNAKARAPYVTGNLMGSIMEAGIVITDDNVIAAVAANASYAGFVEGVDSNWQPLKGWTHKITPFLGPALLENQRTFTKAIEAAVKRAEGAI